MATSGQSVSPFDFQPAYSQTPTQLVSTSHISIISLVLPNTSKYFHTTLPPTHHTLIYRRASFTVAASPTLSTAITIMADPASKPASIKNADSTNLTPSVPSRAESPQSAISQNGTPATSTRSTTAGVDKQEEAWKLPTNGPLKTPIPWTASKVTPPKPAELNPEQEVK
jgi:hypothetical protein